MKIQHIILVAMLLFFPIGVLGGMIESLENGKQIYKESCRVCHGDNGDGQTFVRNAIKIPPTDFTDKALIVQLTVERMRRAILMGKPGTAMPSWRYDLTAPQVNDVIIYIRKEIMGDVLAVPVLP